MTVGNGRGNHAKPDVEDSRSIVDAAQDRCYCQSSATETP
ncbi:hypothetical protein EV129_13227 [Rhizobium azibense]|uniref:Uncharacterized protein n=1 Tax=Rhizobium azibense TaxID=1136135 RepID=A0A4R3R7Z2_9HYPH|nr:hypothetical protein EV129_13227 [Rhizobium azibense]